MLHWEFSDFQTRDFFDFFCDFPSGETGRIAVFGLVRGNVHVPEDPPPFHGKIPLHTQYKGFESSYY
jgi:hypothetical protein